MAATICPTVLAENAHVFREQMERVEPFAKRIHIDLADGLFAPSKTVGFDQVWWPDGCTVDLHVMCARPLEYLEQMRKVAPRLVIVHAEAEGDFRRFADALHQRGIKVGVALLPQTAVSAIELALAMIDHVLVFSGDLGHFGGQANLQLLSKVRQLRDLKPALEIGWDGGINADNARELADGGVDVLNVGGFIQKAPDAAKAYQTLASLVAKPIMINYEA